MSKRTKLIIAVVALLVVGGVAASFALKAGGGGTQIKSATVSQADLGVTVSASGKVQAGVRADVYPPTAGTLAFVYVSDGETVTAGDRIAKMDTGPLEYAVKQAKAGLAQAQSAYDNVDAQAVSSGDVTAAKANVTATKKAWLAAKDAAGDVSSKAPTQGQLDAAEAAKDAADSAYDNATDAYDAALIAYGSTSPTTTAALTAKKSAYAGYLSAKATYDGLVATDLGSAHSSANAGVASAYAAYKAAQSSLKKAQAADPASQKSAAAAAVTQAKKALELAENNLGDATLVAPIDGTVFFNAVGTPGSDGETPKAAEKAAVAPQSAPFSVVDLGGSTFVAEVDEADIDRVRVGMESEITLDSFPGQSFKTKVTHISSAAQPTATGGTIFPVELVMQDTGKTILIGMKGDTTIKVSSIPSALTIPLEALFNENGTNFVYKVVDGKLAKTTITIGAQTDTDVEILDGLKKDDVVALASPTTYTDGMAVTVKN
ncbi:MAG: efflux RND transporter periplasmic adaptor subunit [Coriobacteriia bacterium]|nr:efflux RND transporter periplasmic adaptor subunit [Coriobacteriia bacterium]